MTTAVVAASAGHAVHGAGATGWIDYFASVAVVLAFVFAGPWLAMWSVRRGQVGEDDSDGGHGHGGGGPDNDPTPPTRPPDSDPAWWPEFEREFAAYVESQFALAGTRG